MRIGVIGGSGFIGSHVVDKLLDAGHEVTVFDIMQPHRNDVRQIQIDILSPSRTVIALAGKYDVIYHLAAVANVNDVFRNPAESIEVNVQGTTNVVEAVRRNGIPRLIFASTIWVYNLSNLTEVDEDTPLKIGDADHVYTASKVAGELVLTSYAKLYGVKTTILRYGIPYGPRARSATLLALFVNKALSGEKLTIDGDGSQTRNFIYVEDLAAGNVAALSSVAINQTYNLEGPRPISVLEVAETVRELVGYRAGHHVEIENTPARPGDYKPKIISSKKALAELSWRPEIDFSEGARNYFKWLLGKNDNV